MKTTSYEIEIDAEAYASFKALCEEQDLDMKEELKQCLEMYIANLKEETESL